MRGGKIDGFGWAYVEEKGGGVESFCPKTRGHRGLN
jgi:hypothetical protein